MLLDAPIGALADSTGAWPSLLLLAVYLLLLRPLSLSLSLSPLCCCVFGPPTRLLAGLSLRRSSWALPYRYACTVRLPPRLGQALIVLLARSPRSVSLSFLSAHQTSSYVAHTTACLCGRSFAPADASHLRLSGRSSTASAPYVGSSPSAPSISALHAPAMRGEPRGCSPDPWTAGS